MNIQALPKFTPQAAKLWSLISKENKKILLENVWCGKCRETVIIKNFTGVVKSGDLLLVGQCSLCHSDVGRLIESE